MRLARCSPKTVYSRFRMQSFNALRISRCCFVFTPRQGTMVVAVIELSLTSVLLFLLLIAAMNAQDIASATSSDSDDVENNWTSVFGDRFSLSWYYNKNERKMINGQNLARVMVMLTFGGVVLSMIHIFSCLMLLYGALYDIPHFLIPWLTTVLFSLIVSSLILVTLMLFIHHKCMISVYILPFMLLMLEVYSWLVVFNYYKDVTLANHRSHQLTNSSREEGLPETKNGVFDF